MKNRASSFPKRSSARKPSSVRKQWLAMIAFGLVLAVAVVPLDAREVSATETCPKATLPHLSQLGSYPDHAMSPMEALRSHDIAFYGELMVPARKCSLGYCAGLRVLKGVKGDLKPQSTVLLQIKRSQEGGCPPPNFGEGQKTWFVFANRGTSKTGIVYFYADYDGPSFPSYTAPDLELLDRNYVSLRESLDYAIERRASSAPKSSESNL